MMNPETFKDTTKNQLWYYRHVIKKMRSGSFSPISERLRLTDIKFHRLTDGQQANILQRFVDPEKLAAYQIIIEEFFRSAQYLKAKASLFNSPNPSQMINKIESVLKLAFDDFVIENDTPIFKKIIRLLENNREIFKLEQNSDSPYSKKDYFGTVFAGIHTADNFYVNVAHVVRKRVKDIPEREYLTEDKKQIIQRAIRDTFQRLGALLASLPLSTLIEGQLLISTDEGLFKDNFFYGDLSKGEVLRLNKRVLKLLSELMAEPSQFGTAKFGCPALVRTETGSPLKKCALLYANTLLYEVGLISHQELIDSD